MSSIMEWLSGKKSFLQAGGIGVVVIVWYVGLLDDSTATMLLGLLGAGSVASLRAGMNKSGS